MLPKELLSELIAFVGVRYFQSFNHVINDTVSTKDCQQKISSFLKYFKLYLF